MTYNVISGTLNPTQSQSHWNSRVRSIRLIVVDFSQRTLQSEHCSIWKKTSTTASIIQIVKRRTQWNRGDPKEILLGAKFALRPSFALLHGARAEGVSQTLRRGTSNGIKELLYRAPPIFGKAAITLGIGPHSSIVQQLGPQVISAYKARNIVIRHCLHQNSRVCSMPI